MPDDVRDEIEEPQVAALSSEAEESAPEGDGDTYTPEYDADGYDQYGFNGEGLNREGVHMDEWQPAAEPEAQSPAPEAPPPTAPPPPTAAPPAARQIITRESMFTQAEQDELTRLDLENPGEAASRRYERLRRLENYAQDLFDADMDTLAAEHPQVAERFERQIQRVRRNLSVEQLQSPGIARTVAAQVVVSALAQRPDLIGKVMDLFGSAPSAPSKPETKAGASAPRPKPVIPPEMRPPIVRNPVSRTPSAARSAPGNALERQARELYPWMTEAEIREYVEGIQSHESQQRRR